MGNLMEELDFLSELIEVLIPFSYKLYIFII